jgi:non-specific serine/threonine protein kinase
VSLVGTTISHYKVLGPLGEGGMGDVFRAEDMRLGRQVALKMLRLGSRLDEGAQARMLTEAKALAALDHPHICTLFEFGNAEGRPFLAMQLVEGETLRDALRRGPLGEARTREVVGALAAALAAAHARGVLHRDVKCENVLLGRDGAIKLSDFGIARLANEAALTGAGNLVGSPGSISPEQLRGGEAAAASDQFSLAVLAYECLTGRRPFGGDSFAASARAILEDDPAPIPATGDAVAPAWEAVLRRALAKEPAHRFPTVDAFAAALPSAGFATAGKGGADGAAKSVAVLYFENLSSDAESDYFCAGITEDILTDLSRIEGLNVPSRNAVARYRGQSVDIKQVARELGVGAVLEGSVRKAGNRVRISAQLINASNGYHLWAERYDRTLDDVFAVQEDIARSISAALRGELTPEELSHLQENRPASARAYDLYLRAGALYGCYTREEMYDALDLYQHAVALDPGYALAWAGIGNACGQFLQWRWDADRPWSERGRFACARAAELAPRLPDAYKALAMFEEHDGMTDEGLALNRKALELDPNFVPSLVNASLGERMVGNIAESERLLRRAIAADPAHPHSYIHFMGILAATRRPSAVVELLPRVLELARGPVHRTGAHAYAGFAYVQLGERAAAEREFAAIGEGMSGGDAAMAGVMRALLAGRESEVRALLQEVEREPLGVGFEPLVYSTAALLLGDAALSARILGSREARHLQGVFSLPLWRVWPPLEPYLDDPAIVAWLGDRGRRMVWPAEAPPLPRKVAAQFTDFRVESGMPAQGVLVG